MVRLYCSRYTMDARYREVKIKLRRTFSPCWLALMVSEGTTQGTVREKASTNLPSCEFCKLQCRCTSQDVPNDVKGNNQTIWLDLRTLPKERRSGTINLQTNKQTNTWLGRSYVVRIYYIICLNWNGTKLPSKISIYTHLYSQPQSFGKTSHSAMQKQRQES